MLPAPFGGSGAQRNDDAASQQQVCQMGFTFPCCRSSQTADEQHDYRSRPGRKTLQGFIKKLIELLCCVVQFLSDTAHCLSTSGGSEKMGPGTLAGRMVTT